MTMKLDDGVGASPPAPKATPPVAAASASASPTPAPAPPAAPSPISAQAAEHAAKVEAAKPAATKPEPTPPAAKPESAPTASPKAIEAAAAKPAAAPSTAGASPEPAPPHAGDTAKSHPLAAVLKSEQAVADRLEREKSVDAATIDAAVPPQRRTELLDQQDAFLGTKRLGQADVDRLLLEQVTARQATKDGDRGSKADATSTTSAPGVLPASASTRTSKEVAAFLSTRDYWIDDDGVAWKVLADGHGGASLERRNHQDGRLTDTPVATGERGMEPGLDMSPSRMRKVALDSGAFTAAELDTLLGSVSDDAPASAVPSTSPPGVVPPAPGQHAPVDGAVDLEADLATALSTRRTASNVVTYAADGARRVDASTVTRSAGGVELTRTEHSSFDADSRQTGFSRASSLRSPTPDGGTVAVNSHSGYGPSVSPGASNPFVKVVIKDAAGGIVRSTDSDHPAPAPEPRTLDELRAAQDRLGVMEERGKTAGGDGWPDEGRLPWSTPADMVAFATQQADAVDRDALREANAIGTMKIAGTYDAYERRMQDLLRELGVGAAPSTGSSYLETPAAGSLDPDSVSFLQRRADPVIQYGEEAFRAVRERLAALGIDASEGNDAIRRNWRDTGLVDEAQYSPDGDVMDFGLKGGAMPFAMSADVIAHEFTHRIVEKQAPGLPYQGQSGAVNESLADTMAATVDRDDWLIGEDTVPGGIRDMATPATIQNYDARPQDHGGVHANAAIPNRAAYLIGTAVGREDMGRIYAQTITEHVDDHTNFESLANGTWRSAVELYGADSAQVKAVQQAWDTVLQLHGDARLWSTTPSYS